MNHRPKEKTFIYGIRAIIEAITAGKQLDKIFLQTGIKGPMIGELRSLASDASIPTKYVPAAKLNFFTQKNHQGAIAFLSPVEFQEIEQIIPMLFEQGKVPLLLVLDRVTDVRNFGAITRVAECAGVDAIVIASASAAAINADAVKSSAGALLRVPICRSQNLIETLQFIKDSGISIVACTEKSQDLIYDEVYNEPLVVVMGGEEKGISNEILSIADHSVKIPLMGEVESLNVSVATGIVLYEAVRQRRKDV